MLHSRETFLTIKNTLLWPLLDFFLPLQDKFFGHYGIVIWPLHNTFCGHYITLFCPLRDTFLSITGYFSCSLRDTFFGQYRILFLAIPG